MPGFLVREASPAIERDECGVAGHRSRARLPLRQRFRRRARSEPTTVSGAARAVPERNGSANFRPDSEAKIRPHRETPKHETHPTSVRRSMFRLPVIRQPSWRASAKSAGSQEDAYLSLLMAVQKLPKLQHLPISSDEHS